MNMQSHTRCRVHRRSCCLSCCLCWRLHSSWPEVHCCMRLQIYFFCELALCQTDSIPISSSFCAFACNWTTMGCSWAFRSTTVGSNKTVELVRRSLTLTAPLSTLPSPILDCFSRPAFAEHHDVKESGHVLQAWLPVSVGAHNINSHREMSWCMTNLIEVSWPAPRLFLPYLESSLTNVS